MSALISLLRKYLTAHRRFIPALATLLWLSVVASCQGFNPLDLTPQPQETGKTTISPNVTATLPPPAPAPSPTPTPVPTSSLGVEPQELSGLTVRFWHARADQFSGGNVLDELAEEFNRTNEWGITVEMALFGSYGEIFQEIQSSLYEELPDVLIGYNYQAAALDFTGGRLADLNEYIHDPVWGLSAAEVGDFHPAFWEQDVIAGKRLGMPFYRSAQLLFYNLTWADELGFASPPGTPLEFNEQACAAAQAVQGSGPGGEGGWVTNTDPPTLLSWIYAFGGQAAAPGGDGYTFDSAETARAFEFLHRLQEQACSWTADSRYPNAEFANRRALLVAGSLTGLAAQQAAFVEAGSSDRWTVIPFPSSSGQPVVTAYGPSFSVMNSSPEVQLASWLFVRWLVSPESQARWAQSYGVYPSRDSVQDLLKDYAASHPQWAEALKLLPYAQVEPAYPSWNSVRWALSDAGSFLFSPFFTKDAAAELAEELDNTAEELNRQYR